MPITSFPSLSTADEDGLLAFGGDTSPESLLLAYSNGIFPWPPMEGVLAWFAPDPRCILTIRDLHISRSLQKTLNKKKFTTKINGNFRKVMESCAKSHCGPDGTRTWITKELINGYTALFEQGNGICVEVFNDKEKLVGGIYGVQLKNFVSAESMFHLEDDASKVALVALCNYCTSLSIDWIDLQVINPFTKKMGAEEISRAQFMKRLRSSLK
jgi:leucyl/phenylalanyl-tRNA--protein transferase